MKQVKTNYTVLTTEDYFMFKKHDGNREVNEAHKNRLKKSMQEEYLFSPIIVNEKYQIIDGNHRFECAQELKLPVNYIIVEGYGLNQMHRLNTNGKNWQSLDYLESYCKMGKQPYIECKRFMDYSGLKVNYAISILGKGSKGLSKTMEFNKGKFQPSTEDFEFAYGLADKIKKCEMFYNGARRKGFFMALATLCKNDKFDFDVFLGKLKYKAHELLDFSKSSNYIDAIEEIYNHRNRNKVSLKY